MQNEPILPSARWFLPNLDEAITRDLVIQRGDWAAFSKYPGTHNNQATQVKLNLDWKALELDSANAKLYAPAIAGMQTEKLWQPDNSISIAPKRGWLLVLDEVPRRVPPEVPTTQSSRSE